MVDTARITTLTIRKLDDGERGYRIENAFGQTIQVLPRPPRFQATIVMEWEGAMPDEVDRIVRQARAAGLDPGA